MAHIILTIITVNLSRPFGESLECGAVLAIVGFIMPHVIVFDDLAHARPVRTKQKSNCICSVSILL